MLQKLRRINSLLRLFGLDVQMTLQSAMAMPWFLRSYGSFRRTLSDAKFPLGKWYPCLHDRSEESGVASGGYFHQDLLVARRIFERQPRRHADFGSRIDGFVAHVAAFREIDVFDIRPLHTDARNIHFKQLDLMHGLDQSLLGHYDSVSCLHALEHFGLGRYGDELDYQGHLKGFEAISKSLSKSGIFYLSVPLGPQRIEFNAHRVFSVEYLRGMCESNYDIERVSYVDDEGRLFEDISLDLQSAKSNFDCHYGVIIFELRKK